jgi:pilus assembly protein TadC
MKDRLSRLYPQRLQDHLVELLIYNGIHYKADRLMGAITGGVFATACILALVLAPIYKWEFFIFFASTSLILFTAVYSYLVLRAEGRGRFVERMLPDFLKLMSSNLRSGLSVDAALMHSVRPEFGFFKTEVHLMAGMVISGDSFEEALIKLSKRIRSDSLEITIDLITQGMHSGGELSSSLSRIADILSDREYIRGEIRAGVQMYVTLIMFAVVVGTPLLFSISTFLVEVLQRMSAAIDVPQATSQIASSKVMSLRPTKMPFSLRAINVFATISILSSTFMGSLIIGLISSGNWRRGLKYAPLFCSISLGLFFLIRMLLLDRVGAVFT